MSQLTASARKAVCFLLEELTGVAGLSSGEWGFLDLLDGGTITDELVLNRLTLRIQSSGAHLSAERQAVRRLALLVQAVDVTNVKSGCGHTSLRQPRGGLVKMISGALSLTVTVENLARTLVETFRIDPSQIKQPADLFVTESDVALAAELWASIIGTLLESEEG